MVLTDLVEFHSRYQEISPVELREIEVLLHRHPLHDEEEAEVDHAEVH